MIDRRGFIIATGMTALAASRVFGANEKIRLGLIGAGQRMKGLIDCADKAAPCEIAAVSDVYGPHRDLFKERSGGLATAHLDYREVLDNKDVDAVIIASPDHWHLRMALDAIAAGKDVYLESRSPTISRKARCSPKRCVPASRFCNAECSSAVGRTSATPSIWFREEV